MRAPLRTTWVLPLVAASVAVGCPALDNPYRPFPAPSFRAFTDDVQPLLRRDCAALGCHGSPDRTLTLYAVGFLRAPPPFAGEPLDETRLTEAELRWNYDELRIRLLGETAPDDARLLLKCLDPAAGGIEHADGVVVYESRRDPGFRTLRDWIAEGL